MTTAPAHVHRHGIGSTDTSRRIWAIIGGSSGNLVEWYDFYVYSFTALYFASEFFPKGDQTTQLLNAAGIFAAGFLMRPIGSWFFGRIADKRGRRVSMMIAVIMEPCRARRVFWRRGVRLLRPSQSGGFQFLQPLRRAVEPEAVQAV